MFVNEEVFMAQTREKLVSQAVFLNTLLDILSQFQTTFISGCEQTEVFSAQIARHFRTLESEVFTSLGEVTHYIELKADKEENTDV